MESTVAIAGRIGVRCVALWRIVSFTASREVLSRPGLGIDWSGCSLHTSSVGCPPHSTMPAFWRLVDCIVASMWLAGSSRSVFPFFPVGVRDSVRVMLEFVFYLFS